jgi:hypothetical protein
MREGCWGGLVAHESKLEMATRHVEGGTLIVERQKQLIARMKLSGLNTLEAERLLVAFEKTLAVFRDDLLALQAR